MRYLFVAAVLLAFSAPPTLAQDPKPVINCPGSQKNLQTYLKIHDILFMQRDASRVAEFYGPEIISHNVDSGGASVRKVTPEQMAAMWTASKRNDPERRLVDDLILCSGEYIIVRTSIHAQDNVGVAGNPPTHKSYVISGIDIYRFAKGKVVERWGNADLMSMIQQLGYVVAPKAADGSKP